MHNCATYVVRTITYFRTLPPDGNFLAVTTPSGRNAYYAADISAFLIASENEIVGALTQASSFGVDTSQVGAWLETIAILKSALARVSGAILLEFVVPRIGSRVDAIVLSGPAVFVIEFKVGAREFNRGDRDQAWDYALDLKNFHRASHNAAILPILVATAATSSAADFGPPAHDGVYPPAHCNASGVTRLIDRGLVLAAGKPIAVREWTQSPYQPTPTIIQAAQALYANHSVDAIARNDAGAQNLRVTSGRVEEIVSESRKNRQKSIIFVTGVPGAGKTLVGLNIATQKHEDSPETHAVFLSGNGALVEVLKEALVRDEYERLKKALTPIRLGELRQKVKKFIHNVHHFRDAGLNDPTAPSEHVVIFDEAQRAWNRAMTSDFMRRKKGKPNFDQSEPAFLVSYMDRHVDWAVVICLVGGGQEINRGEAGISEWLDAVRLEFPDWHVFVSPDLRDTEFAAERALTELAGRKRVSMDADLHLATSMRSFRADNVSHFVKAVLDCNEVEASAALRELADKYPIVVTRSLKAAKRWIREKARGSERYGLVASSGAQRLKPHAIDIRFSVNPVHWFLKERDDTRSSLYLEDAATEFQVQGLELDWVCMTWDADLRHANSRWSYNSFVGSRWTKVHKEERQRYLLNAYRVLLTRARQGMAIFVPEGDDEDPTRPREFYDATFEYLSRLGVRRLES
jgi:hypothetical protein